VEGSLVAVAVAALALVLIVAIPVIVVAGLLWMAHRHLSGRRGRFDGLFTGLARGNAMSSHLQAGTPDPDDLAVPIPPRPPRRRRNRRP
jgi:hypothetical protein